VAAARHDVIEFAARYRAPGLLTFAREPAAADAGAERG
jgi:hypothetical protein